MRPFFRLRLVLFRITFTVSNLRLSENFCIILCRVFGFLPLVLTIFGELFLLLTVKKSGLNYKKKPGLSQKSMVYLKKKKKKKKMF